jgi:hypothetical protein
MPPIILVARRDEFPSRQKNGFLKVQKKTEVPIVQMESNTMIPGCAVPENIQSTVRGSIIYYHNLEVVPALGKQGV